MAYTSGTLAATANPALDMSTALHTLLTGNGYTFVEDWTSASETVKVYKSPAAANGVGDWFLYLRRTSDSMTGLQMTVSEAWDATNKKIQKYVPAATSVVPSAAANYTVTDAAGQLPNVTATIAYFLLGTSAAGANPTPYWVSVTPARLIVATRATTTDSVIYAGLGDEVIPNTVAGSGLPLTIHKLIHNSFGGGTDAVSVGGGATREPNTTSNSTYNFGAPVALYPNGSGGGPWGWSTNAADLYTGRAWVARILAVAGRGVGSPRFLMKDMICASNLQATQVNGDTLTVGAKTYVRMASGSGNATYVDVSA